jgi:hypothetical protein
VAVRDSISNPQSRAVLSRKIPHLPNFDFGPWLVCASHPPPSDTTSSQTRIMIQATDHTLNSTNAGPLIHFGLHCFLTLPILAFRSAKSDGKIFPIEKSVDRATESTRVPPPSQPAVDTDVSNLPDIAPTIGDRGRIDQRITWAPRLAS